MPTTPAPTPTSDDIFRVFGRLVFDLAYRLDSLEKQTAALHGGFQSQMEAMRAQLAAARGQGEEEVYPTAQGRQG
jgi:hypothetical protein